MGRFITVVAASISLFFLSVVPVTEAEPSIEPIGNVSQPPDGPAPAWIVADMDTGLVLAERDMSIPHPPASTIKTLLVLTALDELPNLDATVVGTDADTHVECSCAGIEPGRTYSARQLLDAILLMSGNDAANALADMIGGYDTAVAKMNAKAAAIGAVGTHASTPSGLDGSNGAGATTPHDLAVIFRAAMANPVFAQIIAQPTATFPTKTGDRPLTNDDELLHRYPGTLGGKTGFTDAAKKTFVAAADRGGRRLVIAMMYGLIKAGGPTYWDQAIGLFDWGFAQDGRVSVASL
ncbi:MAG TPA: serine hydrolase [Mycobacterium sp.]|jgi:D-alanyl-D-alanine carboxypeptidase (penicillin-binding protein 5/6)|nr:serine hydrolase [Mycobacterium sp.]